MLYIGTRKVKPFLDIREVYLEELSLKKPNYSNPKPSLRFFYLDNLPSKRDEAFKHFQNRLLKFQ